MEHLSDYRKHIPLRWIYCSFLVAIFVDLIPTAQTGSIQLMPDIMAMLILYWTINRPHQFNIGSAFALGLISDIATGSPLGQHALAYTITTYIVMNQQRYIILYHYGIQSIVALGTLMGNQIIMSLIRVIFDNKYSGWGSFLPPIIGALLWPLLNKIMITLYRPRKN